MENDLINALKAQAALEKLEAAMEEFLLIYAAPRTNGLFSYIHKTEKRACYLSVIPKR